MGITSSLQATRDETLKYFDLSPAELGKTYGEGKWNIRQILIHLADAESVLHERIKRVIAEGPQVIWAFNQDLWCNNLDYQTFPLDLSKMLFQVNRESMIFLAGKFYSKSGHVIFVHSETGQRTLKDEFDKVVWHNQKHLSHIKQALSV